MHFPSINLDIHDGEFLSIAGPSGCGKSTLLSILGLLDTPTEGDIHAGRAARSKPVLDANAPESEIVRLGSSFRASNLIGDLTVYENVELPLTYRKTGRSDRKSRVESALERVGMSHRRKHLPSQLSGGQQQRVAVARALVGDPTMLLADEPTGQPGFQERKRSNGYAQGIERFRIHNLHGHPRRALLSLRLAQRASVRWEDCPRWLGRAELI